MSNVELDKYNITDILHKIILIISINDDVVTTVVNLIKQLDNNVQLKSLIDEDISDTNITTIYYTTTIRNIPVGLYSRFNYIIICYLEATSYMLGYVRDKIKTADSFETLVELYLKNKDVIIIDNLRYKIGHMDITNIYNNESNEKIVTEIVI